MKTRKPKPNFRAIKTKLDQACRALVMERDRYTCRRCGVARGSGHKSLQWAHIYSRRYLSVRWHPLNSVALCPGCHLWIHHNPLDGAEWVAREVLTLEQRESLRALLKNPKRLDYEAELLYLQGELRKLIASGA